MTERPLLRPVYLERTEYNRPLIGTTPGITLVNSYPKPGRCSGVCGREIHKAGPHSKCAGCKALTAKKAKLKAERKASV
jgi:hypothetical protein